MSEIFVTSDLHFGHTNIITYCNRPYADADEMNESLIQNWNETVNQNDIVYVLGDFAMGLISETLPMALRLNGRKLLVPGNHDRCWSFHSKGVEKWEREYESVGFQILDSEGIYFLADIPIKLCHFPYRGDHTEFDRYPFARPTDTGQLLLHGHIHDIWKKNGNMINVGVDVWDYKPANIYELLEL